MVTRVNATSAATSAATAQIRGMFAATASSGPALKATVVEEAPPPRRRGAGRPIRTSPGSRPPCAAHLPKVSSWVKPSISGLGRARWPESGHRLGIMQHLLLDRLRNVGLALVENSADFDVVDLGGGSHPG